MSDKKEDRRAQRTRRLLHQAAISLMREKRYNSITVQDIIDRADVGRSTFYAHYQDKEDLVNSNLEEMMEELSRPLADIDSGSQQIIPSLALFEHIGENRQVFEDMGGGQGLDMLLEKGQFYWKKRVEAQLQALLTEGQSPEVPISLVAGYISGAFITFIKWWLDNRLPYSAERMDDMFQQMVMPGVWAALGKATQQ